MFLESNGNLSWLPTSGNSEVTESCFSSYVFFPHAQMEGLFSGSHDDWLASVLWGWVTMVVSLGILQRHHVMSMTTVTMQAAFSAPLLPLSLPRAGSERSSCNFVLSHVALAMVLVRQLVLLHVVSDAPLLGSSSASGQQSTALLFSSLYPGIFSQLLLRKELNSYCSIQPSYSFLPTEHNLPFCLRVL